MNTVKRLSLCFECVLYAEKIFNALADGVNVVDRTVRVQITFRFVLMRLF